MSCLLAVAPNKQSVSIRVLSILRPFTRYAAMPQRSTRDAGSRTDCYGSFGGALHHRTSPKSIDADGDSLRPMDRLAILWRCISLMLLGPGYTQAIAPCIKYCATPQSGQRKLAGDGIRQSSFWSWANRSAVCNIV